MGKMVERRRSYADRTDSDVALGTDHAVADQGSPSIPFLADRDWRAAFRQFLPEAEALERARSGQTWTNYPAIFAGFIEKGIAEHDIKPRENVFTFNAWKALGRSVKKGEHGVKVVTFIDCAGCVEIDQATGEEARATYRRPYVTRVFHISQTEPTAEREARIAANRPLGSGPLDWLRSKRLRHARKIRRMSMPATYGDPGELAADRWNETHR